MRRPAPVGRSLRVPLLFAAITPHALEQPIGVDYLLYRDAAARWLAGGPFFEPYQLAGPYPISAGDILYPPVALWLFVPFTVLPAEASCGGRSRSGSRPGPSSGSGRRPGRGRSSLCASPGRRRR